MPKAYPALLVLLWSARLSALSSDCLAPARAMAPASGAREHAMWHHHFWATDGKEPFARSCQPSCRPTNYFPEKHAVGNLDCFKMPVSGQSSMEYNSTRSSKTAPWVVTYKSQITRLSQIAAGVSNGTRNLSEPVLGFWGLWCECRCISVGIFVGKLNAP